MSAGYCGLMLPVMEDLVLAARAAESPPAFTLRDLLTFSSVCGVGLDTVQWLIAQTFHKTFSYDVLLAKIIVTYHDIP